jgi:uncharacterized membrane protein YdbT with pleckstrin-like domain
MFNLFNLDDHLDSSEKIVLFFRPSRKAYLFQYALLVFVFVLDLALVGYTFTFHSIFSRIARYLLFIALIAMIVILLRLEYRIWSRKYGISTEKVLYSRGILTEHFKSAKYNFITDIGLNQTLWDKIVNTGTLKINTAGTDNYEIKFRKVSDPIKLKKIINDFLPHEASEAIANPKARKPSRLKSEG